MPNLLVKSKRRERVVIFRVTAEEYQRLLDACARDGARSVSDFTRQELFAHLNSGPEAPEDAQIAIEELFGQLRSSVSSLVEEIEALRKKWAIVQ
jgi:fructose-1-phosphate kinase PfkB-like protein